MSIVINENIDKYQEGLRGGITARMVLVTLIAVGLMLGSILLCDFFGVPMYIGGMVSGVPSVMIAYLFLTTKEGYTRWEVWLDQYHRMGRLRRVDYESIAMEGMVRQNGQEEEKNAEMEKL